MPPERKNPIEDLLEASARARRGEFGADPKMPNPMRAQLHHEITRLARKDECESRWRAFGIPWPRLVTATALALVLVSSSVIWWWREHESAAGETMKLALQQPAASANDAAAPEKVFEQGATAAQPAQGFADNSATAKQSAGEKAPATFNRLAGATTPSSRDGSMTKDFVSAREKTDRSLASDISLAAKEAKQSAPTPSSPAQNRQTTNFRQQFAQNAADEAFRNKPKHALNILNEFQVEQTDHEIRVIDSDGSTYSGKLEPLARSDPRSIFKQKGNYPAPASRPAPGLDDKGQVANAEFYFRATGYSSSLKKRLVFEGNYVASSLSAQKKVAEAEERDEQTPARITGTAKVGGESPVQIDAVAVAK